MQPVVQQFQYFFSRLDVVQGTKHGFNFRSLFCVVFFAHVCLLLLCQGLFAAAELNWSEQVDPVTNTTRSWVTRASY